MKYTVAALDSGSGIGKTITKIIDVALEQNATSIHFEPTPELVLIRLRVDGVMRHAHRLPAKHSHDLATRLKHLANLDTNEINRPQDGRWRTKYNDETVEFRITTLPLSDGERIVVRIIRSLSIPPLLHKLGLFGPSLRTLEVATAKTSGVVLVSSPEHQGKSTTLASMMHQVSDPRVVKTAIEDEVKYKIRKTTHLQINRAVGMSPERAISSAINQGSNVIMVNALLDKKAYDLIVHSAISKKLIMLATPSLNAVQATIDLLNATSRKQLSSTSIKTSLAQRLVRRLCKSCRIITKPTPKDVDFVAKLNLPSIKKIHSLEEIARKQFFEKKPGQRITKEQSTCLSSETKVNNIWKVNPHGCEDCNYKGYSGVIGIFEVLEKSDEFQTLLLSKSHGDDLEKQARADGLISMGTDGLVKVLLGLTTLEEVDRVL